MVASVGCRSLACDSFSLLITALQVGQFLPQHFEMAFDKSVAGVSPWLLFFGGLYTHLAMLDILISSGRDTLFCSFGAYRCFILSQPVLQMVGSAVLSAGMWYWFLKYSDTAVVFVPGDPDSLRRHDSIMYGTKAVRPFFWSFVFLVFASSFTAAALIVLFGPTSSITHRFAYSCGLISAVLNGVMWIPQLILTYNYRHKGALSIGWVFASVVMDFVYSIYLANVGVDFSVWANNIPDGVQTTLLLLMILYFENTDHGLGRDSFGKREGLDDIEAPLETTKLTSSDGENYYSLSAFSSSSSSSESSPAKERSPQKSTV